MGFILEALENHLKGRAEESGVGILLTGADTTSLTH